MTQREKNGNCFCSRAAMRWQQSLMMSCDTLVAAVTSSLSPLMTWRLHKGVIGQASFRRKKAHAYRRPAAKTSPHADAAKRQ
jgi:hypothetical protein